MIKNNKGFSLVELLGVVVILILLGLLTVPAVSKVLKDSKKEIYDIQINLMKEGAKNWVADNARSLPKENGEKVFLSLGQLKIGSYVDMLITDPYTDMLFDTETRIIIKKEENKYTYEVIVDDDKSGEEEKGNDINFPAITYNGDLVEYLKVNDIYEDKGLTINNTLCTKDSCNVNGYYVTFIFKSDGVNPAGVNTLVAGNYYVEYIITDRQNGRDLALFRTVIVKE